MPRTPANGIEIEFETFGRPDDRPLVLIMGLGAQMLAWHNGFCEALVARNHYVIRFDNRDCGLSSKMEHAGMPNVMTLAASFQAGTPVTAPYTLSDMGEDTLGLLDALGIRKAHVCGVSMGGMIAQTLAIEHPERLRTVTSMESTTGEPGLAPSTPEAMNMLLSRPPAERSAYIEHVTHMFQVFAGGSDKFDEELARGLAARAFDRGIYPPGFSRQLAAILASGSRAPALATVTVPALVLHGAQDPLVLPAHGEATARAIPGARWMLIEGLGHGLAFPDLWDDIADAIASHTSQSS